LLDLDQAHAAIAVHGQVGVPAEVRDLDADHQTRLDDRGPRRNLQLLAVDRALRHELLLNAEFAEARREQRMAMGKLVLPTVSFRVPLRSSAFSALSPLPWRSSSP